MAIKHFSRGCSTFNCEVCGHKTRMTTQAEDRFCGICEEFLMIQNGLWDDGVEEFKRWGGIAHRDQLVKKFIKRGGDFEALKSNCKDLFAVEA